MYWDVVDVYPLKDRELAVTFDEDVNGKLRFASRFAQVFLNPY